MQSQLQLGDLHMMYVSVCVQAVQSSTVISNGVGTNLSINPLYAGPYGILVSNVDFGQASVPYGLSGVAPKVSSFFTFWNVKVSRHARTVLVHCAGNSVPRPQVAHFNDVQAGRCLQ